MALTKIDAPDSLSVYANFWLLWRYLGVTNWRTGNIALTIYDILMNIFISLWYPIHLTMGLLSLSAKQDYFKNISMTTTCIVCTFKFYCLRWKQTQIIEMLELFGQLDGRIKRLEERKYFASNSMKSGENLKSFFVVLFTGANVSAVMFALFGKERRLMYPAWFPFDWHSSSGLYYAAFLYQFVGITIMIIQNFVNDAISPVTFCLLSGHVRVLAMRASAIGYDVEKTQEQNEQELKFCIDDHIILLRLIKIVENSLSYVIFSMFISSGLNICVVLVYLMFYAEGLFSYIYYTIFLACIALQLFPVYYYGSVLQLEFDALTYSIFSSNWQKQSQSFRKICLIFGEVSLRKLTMVAGGIVNIQLNSFFAICKMSYSLFAVVIQKK